MNSKSRAYTFVFVPGKVADSAVIAVVAIIAIAIMVIVIAVLFYCYKVKNRYRAFLKDFDTVSQITTACSGTLLFTHFVSCLSIFTARQHSLLCRAPY